MHYLLSLLLLFVPLISQSQEFDQFFIDKTLRIDYIFSGNSSTQNISVDQLNQLPQWAGRKHNLSGSCWAGNGNIKVYDVETNKCIYVNTFSLSLIHI